VTRRLSLWCSAALGVSLFACSPLPPAEPPPPPEAPLLGDPASVIPADLDLVARVDLRRLRDALGGAFDSLFEQVMERAPSGERDAATGRLLLTLLLKADTVWLGARPGFSAEQTDSVLVLRGAFSQLVPHAIGGDPAWQRPERLGGGVLRFERPTRKRAASSRSARGCRRSRRGCANERRR
jgi:hypothetical protein